MIRYTLTAVLGALLIASASAQPPDLEPIPLPLPPLPKAIPLKAPEGRAAADGGRGRGGSPRRFAG